VKVNLSFLGCCYIIFIWFRCWSYGSISLILITILQVTTTIGFGSPNKANSYSVHGAALGSKEVDATRQNLGWPYEPFHVPEDVKEYEWEH